MIICLMFCSWPYTYGTGALSALAALSGASGNFHYRRVLKLLHYGRGVTYGPAVLLPAMSAGVLHNIFVTQPILLKQFDCAVCAEVRAASVQSIVGFIMPWTISVLGCLAMAKTKHTIPVPYFLNIKAFSEFLWKKTRMSNLNMMGLLAVNFIGAVFITSHELRTAPKIWRRMGIDEIPVQPEQTKLNEW